MTQQEIRDLHKIQSRNVRHLKRVFKNMTMDINFYLLKNDEFQIGIKTKLLALIYSSISESQFVQILHTPNGFSYSEITQIQTERSIGDSWRLMLDIALNKVGDWNINADLSNRRNKIRQIISDYIENPQELRNKIAHGQWVHALNSKNTKENENTTQRIQNLNVVEISRWAEVHQYLCFIIRDLIQSPQKGFHNNYWINLTELEKYLNKSKNWTLEKRIEILKKKKPAHNKSANTK